ncbi:TetR/AcrR family transcriptional regulator [Chitinimonas sp. BJYL2]|uniref:TetR/AcrR family transcriptional regulator n=1 Tax=Chitinimonas sp. BJYL2 TaxID=2976696 RepID=UPI0022B39BD5|nr:TetR/AcrR family transcriptional regulator [Chitinimonas sp. BJYL2]
MARSKGDLTRDSILVAGIALARELGLGAVSIGELADRAGMSKSGLFAHFGAKETLQLAILDATLAQFNNEVARKAFQAPRGLARLRALFRGWIDWGLAQQQEGGCPVLSAAAEFDDRPGPIRDFLADTQRQWLASLAKSVQLAMEAGELPADTDTDQAAFEIFGLILSGHHNYRLLNDLQFGERAVVGLERLIANPPRLGHALP